MNKKIRFIIEILIIGIIVFFINTFLFQLCFVRGESMVPTLKNGQVLIAKKFDLQIKRNDIVVVKKDGKVIIKRAVGIPNDRINILDGYLYVNGEKFDDRYIQDSGNIKDEITLKSNEYFILGDNRNASIDSRFDEIGIITKKNIIGKIIFKEGE
ncbi:MAG: signal peptidase I [Clostridia bacterium]|nr:signal peptidase I [Clostridia bacterium]